MIYDIRHVTTYNYEAPVAYSLCALRLRPTSRHGQRVIDVQIDIDPPAARRVSAAAFSATVSRSCTSRPNTAS